MGIFEKIVNDAHIIAKESGRDVLEIMKDKIKDIKKLLYPS